MCLCVVIPFILDVRFVDVPAGVIQEKGHTEFLHLLSAVLVLSFIARRIQPFLSLADREVKICTGILCTYELTILHLLGMICIFIYYFY